VHPQQIEEKMVFGIDTIQPKKQYKVAIDVTGELPQVSLARTVRATHACKCTLKCCSFTVHRWLFFLFKIETKT
jgi:hypothetical protein